MPESDITLHQPLVGQLAIRTFDRQIWLAIAVSMAIVIPRSLFIASAHSPSFDDEYHLVRGMLFLGKSLDPRMDMNDPPLGEGMIAIPLALRDWAWGRSPADYRLYDPALSPDVASLIIALWKSVLFLPIVIAVFLWCRKLYGTMSAWLALTCLVVDPTIAAHIPIPALDILSVAGIVVACYLLWNCFERPAIACFIAAGVSIMTALLIKHTALIIPAIVLAYASLWWVLKPWIDREPWRIWWSQIPRRFGWLALMTAVGLVTLAPLTLFDYSRPTVSASNATEQLLQLNEPWPAGIYIRSLGCAYMHGREGHPGYLFGEYRQHGWWYYFPAIACYKVPIGLGIVLVLGLASLRRIPPKWGEWGLVVPAVAWTLYIGLSGVNIGFRHFLAPYTFSLMLASRCLARPTPVWTVTAWVSCAAAAIHVAAWHPHYLSYLNAPHHRPYLEISDSNLDWGQGLKQVRHWIEARPSDGRPIYIHYFGQIMPEPAPLADGPTYPAVRHYLGDSVHLLNGRACTELPGSGLLIISPVSLTGQYMNKNRDCFKALRQHEPDEIINGNLLVYDIDRLGNGQSFDWFDER